MKTRITKLGKWRSVRSYEPETGKSYQTLRRIFEQAGLAFRKVGQTRLVNEDDVAFWMENGVAPKPSK